MVRFSQNYGVQIVEGLLDYFKKKKSESRQQAAGSRGSLGYFKKESGSKTYIIHIRARNNKGPQTKHHGILLSKFYYLGTPKKANADFNSNFWRFIF